MARIISDTMVSEDDFHMMLDGLPIGSVNQI